MAGRLQGFTRNRWLSLVAGVCLQACAGTSYSFGLYSQSLKTRLGYSQETLDALGTAKDIGGNVGIISGLFYNIAPPWLVVLVGAVQVTFGFGMLWLAATLRIPQPPFWQMALYICVGTHGATFFNTAVLVSSVCNFPNSRGVVLGLLKGYIGLSGAIFTQVYIALYAPDQVAFLLLVAWLPPVVALLVLGVIRPIHPPPDPEPPSEERRNFNTIYATGIALAVFLMAVILAQDSFTLNSWTSGAVTAVMLGIFALNGIVPLREQFKRPPGQATLPLRRHVISPSSSHDGLDQSERDGREDAPLLPASDHPDVVRSSSDTPISPSKSGRPMPHVQRRHPTAVPTMPPKEGPKQEDRCCRAPASKPELGEDFTLSEALCTVDFWLLFLAMVCGSGSGLTAINNLAQMGHSLGYGQHSVSAFVSLVSIWNFLGRLAGGFLSERLVHHGLPRPIGLIVTQGIMVVAHLLFACALPGSLHVGSIIVGLGYGAMWAIMPSAASEIFGLRNFGLLYNVFASANPIGSYFLSTCVAGYLYDREASRSLAKVVDPPPGPPTCIGSHCFRLTFIIVGFVCAMGSLTSAVLAWRTRDYYETVARRRRLEEGVRGASQSPRRS